MPYLPKLKRKTIVMISDYVDPVEYDLESVAWEKKFLSDVETQCASLGYKFIFIEEKTLQALEQKLSQFNKDEIIVFNWFEEIFGEENSGYKVTKFLEENDYVFTGATTEALMLSYSKDDSKKCLVDAGLTTPNFFVLKNKTKDFEMPKNIKFPLIIKSLTDHGSFSISHDSIVENPSELMDRVNVFFSKNDKDLIVEEFIVGDEYILAMIGNENPEPLELQKIKYLTQNTKYNLYSHAAKWDITSKEYNSKIIEHQINMEPKLLNLILEESTKAYKALKCTGYARMEFIVKDNSVYFLDINPNPSLEGEFLYAAEYSGYTDGEIILKICELAEEYWCNK